ncbi:MAG: hypothetical protein U0930_04690 [Pirellulales bacterium]
MLWRSHHLRGLGALANFYTASSLEGKLAVVDHALNEAPGEPLAWLFKTVLCIDGNHLCAAQTAFRGLQRCGTSDPLTMALLSAGIHLERLGNCTEMKTSLNRYASEFRRRAVFNPSLAAFHLRVEDYGRGSGTLGEYVRTLYSEQSPPSAVREFLRVVDIERNLDNRGTEIERTAVINLLAQKLSDAEVQRFMARALAMRLGTVSQTDFYSDLQELIDRHAIDLTPYPKMASYLKYVADSAAIDFAVLHGNIWEMEQTGYAALCQTSDERTAVFEIARLRVAVRLVKHLEGKDPQGQLAATVAPNVNEVRKTPESMKKSNEPKLGLINRIKRWFKN